MLFILIFVLFILICHVPFLVIWICLMRVTILACWNVVVENSLGILVLLKYPLYLGQLILRMIIVQISKSYLKKKWLNRIMKILEKKHTVCFSGMPVCLLSYYKMIYFVHCCFIFVNVDITKKNGMHPSSTVTENNIKTRSL